MQYPNKSGIKIRERAPDKSNKKAYWQVDIPKSLNNGKRILKQFSSATKAKEYARNHYDQFRLMGTGISHLSEPERAEAVLAFQKCKSAGVSLLQALDVGIPIIASKSKNKTLSDIINERIEFKENRLKTEDLRRHTHTSFKTRAGKVDRFLGSYNIAEINREVIMNYFKSDKNGYRNRKNDLAVISECTKYALEEGYIANNPTNTLTPTDRIIICGSRNDRKTPTIMDLTRVEWLINKAYEHPKYNVFNSLVVQFFCGVRTEEISLVNWDCIDFAEKKIFIRGETAKKRFLRDLDIPDNALQWLSLSDKSKPFVDSKFRQYEGKMRSFRLKIGDIKKWKENGKVKTKSNWDKNIIRHTFASHHFNLHRKKHNSSLTEYMMGHRGGDTVLFNNYLDLVRGNKGKEYFNIVPKPSGEKVIPISSVA